MADTNGDLFRLTLTNTLNQTLDLSDLANYVAEESDGFGMPPVRRLSERASLEQGAIDAGFRLEPRRLKFRLKARAASPVQLYARRAELLKFFAPADEPLVLKVTLPGGEERCVQCHLESGLGFGRANRQGFVQASEIGLIAPDPTFYDPEPSIVNFLMTTCPKSVIVTNLGNWRAYPFISLGGPWANPQITSSATGETIGLSCSILAGQEIQIDLQPGRRRITDGAGQSLIRYLDPDSDFATFHLESQVPDGANNLNFQGTGVTNGSWVSIQWNNRYIGI